MTEIMLNQLLSKLLKLDKNEAQVKQIKDKTIKKVNRATAILEKQGQIQQILIMKTATLYITHAFRAWNN